MSACLASDVRPATAAGRSYPAERGELQFLLDRLLSRAAATVPSEAGVPKALVVPHASYASAGTVAADAYARLAPAAGRIRRVVLLGAAHRTRLAGLAVPSVGGFATPLGTVPLDRAAVATLAGRSDVEVSDAAHRLEDGIEVQLPFLQEVLREFALVPVLVGAAHPDAVAQLLVGQWGGPETLLVVTSNLSRQHGYEAARRLDASTASVLESQLPGRLDEHMACGWVPLEALLRVGRQNDFRATTLALKNSGDTAGDRARVVGYGAWAFARNLETQLAQGNRRMLLSAALRTLRAGAARRRRPHVAVDSFERELQCVRASFVTLALAGRPRGSAGGTSAERRLVADVARNAYSAGFEDRRFAPLGEADIDRLDIAISVPGIPLPLGGRPDAEVAALLQPGRDGLVVQGAGRRGVFLPTAWRRAETAAGFVARLRRTAGLAEASPVAELRWFRFTAESFGAAAEDIAGWDSLR